MVWYVLLIIVVIELVYKGEHEWKKEGNQSWVIHIHSFSLNVDHRIWWNRDSDDIILKYQNENWGDEWNVNYRYC